MLGTLYPPGRVTKMGGDSPQGYEEPTPLRQTVVARRWSPTTRTAPAYPAMRLHDDFDRRWLPLGAIHVHLFVYQEVHMYCPQRQPPSIEIIVQPHGGIRGCCSRCRRPAPGYDRLPQRRWLFVPLWGIPTHFCYAPRRGECAEHGGVVGHIPLSDGKPPVTRALVGVFSRWGRRLSWRETARAFQTSWEAVYRSVEWFVQWGLDHRELRGVESIGVDEIHWGRGLRADNFLTVIYQIDAKCRRLLWVGRRRSQATLRRGLYGLRPRVVKGLRFVCSDMWKPYLQGILFAAELVR